MSELDDIEILLSKMDKEFETALLSILAYIQSKEALNIIRAYLELGQIEQIVQFVNEQVKNLTPVIAQALIDAGNQQAKILKPRVQGWVDAQLPKNAPKPLISVSFNPGNPRAAEIIRSRTETLIREITDNQRLAVYDSINRMLLRGANSVKIAKDVAQSVGLTRAQEQAVQNYKRLLEKGSKQALERGLRDRRFDNSVRRASEKPLSQDQIDKMVEGYRNRYIRLRARTIARTEAGRAMSEAQEEALRQTIQEFNIPEDEVVRTWRTTMDGRQRDTHAGLNGVESSMNGYFTTFMGNRLRFPRDPQAPAGEVINCRCTLTTDFKRG